MDKELEQQIVEKAKGDLKAFEELYELYVRKIYSYVASMIGNNSDAEDIVSETFEKAMLNIDKYEYRGYSFGAWLYRIARNLVYDRTRNNRTIQLPDYEIKSENHSIEPENYVQRDELTENLYKSLDELSPDQKEIITLRYIQGYSIKEVCEITERTEDSIKSLAKRALQSLRELNEKYE